MSDLIVPVDKEITKFTDHLEANPRTILSSKFGDGKSYFISKIKEDKRLLDKYEFITLYPVNYQVVSNKDIFELIKRDMLFQLLLKGMMSNRVILTQAEALSWFIRMNKTSLIADILPYIAEVGMDAKAASAVLGAIKGLKLFTDLKNKFKDFKKKYNEEDEIEAFLEKTEATGIYEFDTITAIIQKTIKDYQQRTSKKIVLFIEDLDRMDPAHLFRILNLLSAHIDYGYKVALKPDKSLVGNKFGIDNIILVVDYSNLCNIYHHFYGEQTDFKGYISKFLSSVPFRYSLKETRKKYIQQKLEVITSVPANIIKKLFDEGMIESSTMREIVQALDIEHQIREPVQIKTSKGYISLNIALLKLMAIMKRLKITDEDIIEKIMSIRKIDESFFLSYVCPYLLLEIENSDGSGKFYKNDKNYGYVYVTFSVDRQTGKASIGNTISGVQNNKITDFKNTIELMLTYIV